MHVLVNPDRKIDLEERELLSINFIRLAESESGQQHLIPWRSAAVRVELLLTFGAGGTIGREKKPRFDARNAWYWLHQHLQEFSITTDTPTTIRFEERDHVDV